MEIKLPAIRIASKTPSQNSVQVKCRLLSLKCCHSTEKDGDEVFIKFENKKIWPVGAFARFKTNEEFVINLDVISDGRGFIRLDFWEKDFFKDDLIGYFQFVTVGSRGIFSTDLTPCHKDARPGYVLAWEM